MNWIEFDLRRIDNYVPDRDNSLDKGAEVSTHAVCSGKMGKSS